MHRWNPHGWPGDGPTRMLACGFRGAGNLRGRSYPPSIPRQPERDDGSRGKKTEDNVAEAPARVGSDNGRHQKRPGGRTNAVGGVEPVEVAGPKTLRGVRVEAAVEHAGAGTEHSRRKDHCRPDRCKSDAGAAGGHQRGGQ